MGWLDLSRIPEPEAMEEADEVEAYASTAAQAYLIGFERATMPVRASSLPDQVW